MPFDLLILGVVTVTVRGPDAAPARMLTVIGIEVVVPLVPMAAVTPVPLKATAVAPSKLFPLITAGIVWSGAPPFG